MIIPSGAVLRGAVERFAPGILGSSRPCLSDSSSRMDDLLIWLGFDPTFSCAAAILLNNSSSTANAMFFMVMDFKQLIRIGEIIFHEEY
jgi:hypothetical protein